MKYSGFLFVDSAVLYEGLIWILYLFIGVASFIRTSTTKEGTPLKNHSDV